MHLELKDKTPLTIWSLWPLFMAFMAIFAAPILVYFYAKHDLKLAMIVFALNALVVLLTVLSFSVRHDGKEQRGVLALPTLIKAYWDRNVRGYEIHCFYNTDEQTVASIEVTRRQTEDVRAQTMRCSSKGLLVILPLGGWFSRSQIFNSTSIDMNYRWRVKLLSAEEEKSILVSLQDRQGDRMRVNIHDALSILAISSASYRDDEWRAMAKYLNLPKRRTASKAADAN